MDSFHLIGIKGTGMCALASVLKDLGYKVSGSDFSRNYFTTTFLEEKNIISLDFNKKNITKDKIYISSHAYDESNIEIKQIKKLDLPLYYYSNFIAQFFKGIKIGVSGTHGKTTVTSIIKDLLPQSETTYLVGDGNGGGNPDYKYFVFEACEYKNHFHNYNFDYLIINNIELDHPDFFSSIEEVISSFQMASDNSSYLIINGDDENCKKIRHDNKITFGLKKHNDIYGVIKEENRYGYFVDVFIKGTRYSLNIPFPGLYMVYNFLAALGLFYSLELRMDMLQQLIINVKKPRRRLEEYFYYDNVIIDDYAHHPTEIKSCIDAIKQKYPEKDLIIIFQPHTYSRTLELLGEFKDTFSGIKNFYLEKTFTSIREQYDEQKEEMILKSFKNAIRFNQKIFKRIKKAKNSCIVFLGAGDVNRYIKEMI